MRKLIGTQKQIKAARYMVENGGNASKAMIQAGYSPNTAKTPQKLTGSENFKQLWRDMLPDDLLLKTHFEGLQACRYELGKKGEKVQVPDLTTRHKYLETAYKIKGYFNAGDVNIVNNNLNLMGVLRKMEENLVN
jgi:hypothetical protein